MFRAPRYDLEQISVMRNDMVLLAADGISERSAANGRDFQVEELVRRLAADPSIPVRELLQRSWRNFDSSSGGQLAPDDQSIAIMRFSPV